MGLFVQDVHVNCDGQYIVQKLTLPKIKKDKVDLYVAPGTVALVGSQKFKGQSAPYKITADMLGGNGIQEIFLYQDKSYDSITVNFFGGQYEICLHALNKAKAKFSIVGNAVIEIGDFRELARFFNKSITKEELIDEINSNYRVHLTNEISATASKYITAETTEITLQAALNNIINDVMTESKRTSSLLFNMGLLLSKRGISLHLNTLDDADEKIKLINDALTASAIDSLNDPQRDREEAAADKERQFEIDKIRAQNTVINESVTNQNKTINATTNGNAPITINEKPTTVKSTSESKTNFCPECGEKITSKTAKFCPNCGHKIQ